MKFLVVSQRAIPNPNFRLNDLTGHGRIDVVMRCILAACRLLPKDNSSSIYCYLKGSDNHIEHGWLTWEKRIDNHDEVSLAAVIHDNWSELFTQGKLINLIRLTNCQKIIYLHEEGEVYDSLHGLDDETLIVLGAQSDLTSEDLKCLDISSNIKLSDKPMLASQVIALFRQLRFT